MSTPYRPTPTPTPLIPPYPDGSRPQTVGDALSWIARGDRRPRNLWSMALNVTNPSEFMNGIPRPYSVRPSQRARVREERAFSAPTAAPVAGSEWTTQLSDGDKALASMSPKRAAYVAMRHNGVTDQNGALFSVMIQQVDQRSQEYFSAYQRQIGRLPTYEEYYAFLDQMVKALLEEGLQ